LLPPVLLRRQYRSRILEIVQQAELPLSVNDVRTKAKIVNWESTKALLLELALEGKIKGLRTSRGWVFSAAPLQVQQLQR